jgi:hypothetical protein
MTEPLQRPPSAWTLRDEELKREISQGPRPRRMGFTWLIDWHEEGPAGVKWVLDRTRHQEAQPCCTPNWTYRASGLMCTCSTRPAARSR